MLVERVSSRVNRLLLWVQNALYALGERLGEKAGEEQGQSLVEYAIIVALIAVVSMAAIQALGGGIGNLFQKLLGRIQGIG